MANINDYGFPFSSVGGDRQYSSSEWRDYFRTLIKDGVVQNYLNGCQVKPQTNPNKTVFVDTGTVLIQGAMRILETAQILSIDDNTSGNPRIDRIVARMNFTDRLIEFAILKGTPASNPVAASLTRNTSVWELALADITLPNGFSSITGTAITDQRPDTNLCGASSMTIGVIPPSGMDAETVVVSDVVFNLYGEANVNDVLRSIGYARYYGKYSQMSGGDGKTGSVQSGIVTFTSEDNDDFSAINISDSNSRITIPAGVSKVRFYFNGTIGRTSQSHNTSIRLRKNGSEVEIITKTPDVSGQLTGTFFSKIYSVVPGDYFELYAQMSSLETSQGQLSAGSAFGMEVLS